MILGLIFVTILIVISFSFIDMVDGASRWERDRHESRRHR